MANVNKINSTAKRRSSLDLVIFDVYRDGHRRDYFRVLRRVLGGHVVWGPIALRWPLLLGARKLVCSTCDDYLPSFFAIAICRALLGKATIGLSIRSETIFHRSGPAQIAKRLMLKCLKLIPRAEVITFMPYWVEPRLRKYTSDWMYDIQYWDLPWLNCGLSDSLRAFAAELRQEAAGRPIVVSIGHQRRVKGVEYFMTLYEQPSVRAQFLFVCVGPNWDIDEVVVGSFLKAGGIFRSLQLRDDEIFSVYDLADIIWVCYQPEYDQSSGIFGRAIQLERPTIVREGSYLATLQSGLGMPGFALPFANVCSAATLMAGEWRTALRDAEIWDDRSASFLHTRLGISYKSASNRLRYPRRVPRTKK